MVDDRVMVIDFERARLTTVRTALSEVSPNLTMPRVIEGGKHVQASTSELKSTITESRQLDCQ